MEACTYPWLALAPPLHTIGEKIEVATLPLGQEGVPQLQHVAVHDAVPSQGVVCTNAQTYRHGHTQESIVKTSACSPRGHFALLKVANSSSYLSHLPALPYVCITCVTRCDSPRQRTHTFPSVSLRAPLRPSLFWFGGLLRRLWTPSSYPPRGPAACSSPACEPRSCLCPSWPLRTLSPPPPAASAPRWPGGSSCTDPGRCPATAGEISVGRKLSYSDASSKNRTK